VGRRSRTAASPGHWPGASDSDATDDVTHVAATPCRLAPPVPVPPGLTDSNEDRRTRTSDPLLDQLVTEYALPGRSELQLGPPPGPGPDRCDHRVGPGCLDPSRTVTAAPTTEPARVSWYQRHGSPLQDTPGPP
jgi:hypothetical protein